ncbi:MAG: GDSL-type esterase/lipase family protein [Alphaproteobacteria bacterium]
MYKYVFPFEQIKSIKSFFLPSLPVTNAPSKPRNELFKIFCPQSDVVMIGDSITEYALWNEIFPYIRIANRGVGCDRTDDILERMEEIFSVNAKKAFLMFGINDIFAGVDVNTIFNNYIQIIKKLQDKNISCYVQSTLECSKLGHELQLKYIRSLNRKLKKYCTSNGLEYININNEIDESDYTADGIHLLASGYLKWSKTIALYFPAEYQKVELHKN